jgi:hypothetical protein
MAREHTKPRTDETLLQQSQEISVACLAYKPARDLAQTKHEWLRDVDIMLET